MLATFPGSGTLGRLTGVGTPRKESLGLSAQGVLRRSSLGLLLALASGSEGHCQAERNLETFGRAASRRYAVVIGVDEYHAYSVLKPLEYAEKDATGVGAALEAAGWSVRLRTTRAERSSDRPDGRLRIETDVQLAGESGATVLFYFSGHGFEGQDGNDYLCVADTDPDRLEETGVRVARIREILASSPAKHRVMILDACRSRPEKADNQRSSGTARSFGKSMLEKTEGLGILLSTAPGKPAFEPEPGIFDLEQNPIDNGVFTHFLLRGLSGEAKSGGADETLSFREIERFVGTKMAEFSRARRDYAQQPRCVWEAASGDDIELIDLPRFVLPPDYENLSQPTDVDLVTGWPRRIRHKATRIDFWRIDPGRFESAPVDQRIEPTPVERVARPFYLAETEATLRQWRASSQASELPREGETIVRQGDGFVSTKGRGSPSAPFPDVPFRMLDDMPATFLSLDDALAFCAEFDFRLPTEAEWELAARAGAIGDDPLAGGMASRSSINGADPDHPLLDFETPFRESDAHPFLAVVTALPQNEFGLRGMIGNVFEWCAKGDVAVARPGNDVSLGVIRGGSWFSPPTHCRFSTRFPAPKSTRTSWIGFRVAKSFEISGMDQDR